MNLHELRRRENLDALICSTLSTHLTRMSGETRVVSTDPGRGQPWVEHRLFGAFLSPHSNPAARAFLADLYRFTPRRSRMIPQLVAVSLAQTAWASRRLSAPAFWIDPGLDGAGHLAILPGNQRVRLLDFGEGRTHVFQKTGFALDTLEREWNARHTEGPFLPILEGSVAEGWLSEPLIDGWALARCPPWMSQEPIARSVLEALETWGRRNARVDDRYAESLVDRIETGGIELDRRYRSSLGGRAAEIARAIAPVGELVVMPTHGDFQAGNVLVPRDGSSPIAIDLEHASERSEAFDALTWTLKSRSAHGFADRVAAFLEGRLASPKRMSSRSERRHALVPFVLEELTFFIEESLTGPFTRPSHGLRLLVGELNRLTVMQGAWWRGA